MWDVRRVQFETRYAAALDLLKRGWEPFAVDNHWLYLRKQESSVTKPGQADVPESPPKG